MPVHITQLLRRTRAKRPHRPPAQQPQQFHGGDVSSWSASTLQALAQACCMGLLMPPPPDTTGERQDPR